jgi:hypothetical protein
MPCQDSFVENILPKLTHHHESDEAPHRETCSPFCACICCHISIVSDFTLVHEVGNNLDAPFEFTSVFVPFGIDINSFYSNKIFHPPIV